MGETMTTTTMTINLTVNGEKGEVSIEPGDTLNFVLREKLGLTGTKKGCDSGGCGACTVLMDRKPVYSCMGRRLRPSRGCRTMTMTTT